MHHSNTRVPVKSSYRGTIHLDFFFLVFVELLCFEWNTDIVCVCVSLCSESGSVSSCVLEAILHSLSMSGSSVSLHSVSMRDLSLPRAQSLTKVFSAANANPKQCVLFIPHIDEWLTLAQRNARATLFQCLQNVHPAIRYTQTQSRRHHINLPSPSP